MEAGRYKPYPAYKGSYAVWSGDVPEHWVPIRLKHVFTDKKKQSDPTLPAGSISFGNVIYKNEDSLAKETKAAYQVLEDGEFLINPLNMNYDLLSLRTALSSINVVVSTGYMILQSAEGYNKNYLRWLLQQFDVAHMKTLGAGVRQTISYTDIGNSFIFQPSLPEQTQIAAFLDYETAQIDALIAKQQRLIALLEEKRQAVVSHAVTKGLDKSTPLRPSGIEWLGDVPAHWEVKRLKHIASIFGRIGYRGYTINDIVDEGEGAIVLSPSNVKDERFSLEKRSYLSWEKYHESPEIMVSSGDILFVKTGSTFGKSTLVRNVEEPMTINPQMALLKVDKTWAEFVSFFFKTSLIKATIKVSNTGSGMPTMTQENLGQFPVLLASSDETNKIVGFLNQQSDVFDVLVSKAQSAITLLKERRTALISAAVTGKIDLRDWQPPEVAQPHLTQDISQPEETLA